ncbi:putative peptidoglycan glycosyltransferase FtsW [Paraglaciecola mesophila]|uniref:Probable peptidoglycan glycosyltransferase FtsW n=1 Tax=Paraglaciecola mesophila TaxID=197222 RepID=A0A857JM49_9ALTE|nr:cell division protein FtsW [Paraglaciecola mesophila]QHJ13149.1 putative peptidoglycan glycosyltransferase FtsW [Paraglaciecola mesophila]
MNTSTFVTPLRAMFAQRHDAAPAVVRPYDVSLILLALSLMAIGLVIVTSASMPVASRLFDNPFHFAIRHGIYLTLAIGAALAVMQIPMQWWRTSNAWLLLLGLALLVAVLLVGRSVNGSTRWLAIGPITIQAAEPAKLFFFCYLAGYLVRRYEEVTENIKGFAKPLVVFFAFAFLLLMQPDLGTVVVMLCTTIGLLFLAGAKLWQFFGLAFAGGAAVTFLIMFEEYRMKRITSFLDPWADPFGSGYQLTQSLMAYGRGDLFGQGLGNSLQKLEYLPEAHTDFIMAILAEELGFAGVLTVLALMLGIVLKAMKMGSKALQNERPFDAYLAYSIGIWFSFQTAVNVGASAGILPTKGLTFPLLSYGGSSLIIMAAAVGLLVRIDFEMRVEGIQAINRGGKAKPNREKSKSKAKTTSSAGKKKVSTVLDDVAYAVVDEEQEMNAFMDDFAHDDSASYADNHQGKTANKRSRRTAANEQEDDNNV